MHPEKKVDLRTLMVTAKEVTSSRTGFPRGYVVRVTVQEVHEHKLRPKRGTIAAKYADTEMLATVNRIAFQEVVNDVWISLAIPHCSKPHVTFKQAKEAIHQRLDRLLIWNATKNSSTVTSAKPKS